MNIDNKIKRVELIERIGIDRSTVNNFSIDSTDTEYIASFKNVKFKMDDYSPLRLSDGSGLGSLTIKDKKFGEMKVEFSKSNFTGQYYFNTSLSIAVSDNDNNLQNLNVSEYRERIDAVFGHLSEVYRIEVDYSTLRINKLEINATFFLNEPYSNYKQVILMIMRNVSPKRFSGNKSNNGVKYASWYEANMKNGTDKLETSLVKNSSIELKIYNKLKQLQDIGAIGDVDEGVHIMRVEYSIKDRRILQSAFGDDLVTSLSDKKVNDLFKRYFNRDVVAPYHAWKSNNKRELLELVKSHRETNPSRWNEYFLRDCRQRNEVNGLPTLFDIYDLQSVIRELEPPTGRNAGKKFKNFLKKSIYEADLIGNTKRMKEIISKVLEM